MKDKFGKWESVCILSNALLHRSLTYSAGCAFGHTGSGGTLCAVIAGVIALIILYALMTVYGRHGAVLTAKMYGGAAHSLIFGAAALFLFVSAVCTLYDFSYLIKSLAYPNTPIWYIFVFLAAAALFGGFGKKRSIASAHAIIFPISAAAIAVLCLSSLPQADVSNLFPLLGSGGGKFTLGILSALSVYADAVLILPAVEDFTDCRTPRGIVMTAAIIAVIFNIAVPLCFQLITLNRSELISVIPIYKLTKSISYGRFFQHPSALFLAFWAMSGILYCAAAIHYAVRVVRNLRTKGVSGH